MRLARAWSYLRNGSPATAGAAPATAAGHGARSRRRLFDGGSGSGAGVGFGGGGVAVAELAGHRASFSARAHFSRCGAFIAAGSACGRAFVLAHHTYPVLAQRFIQAMQR